MHYYCKCHERMAGVVAATRALTLFFGGDGETSANSRKESKHAKHAKHAKEGGGGGRGETVPSCSVCSAAFKPRVLLQYSSVRAYNIYCSAFFFVLLVLCAMIHPACFSFSPRSASMPFSWRPRRLRRFSPKNMSSLHEPILPFAACSLKACTVFTVCCETMRQGTRLEPSGLTFTCRPPAALLCLFLSSISIVQHGIIGLKSGVTRRWLGQTFLGYLRVSGTSFGKNYEWQVRFRNYTAFTRSVPCGGGAVVVAARIKTRPDRCETRNPCDASALLLVCV